MTTPKIVPYEESHEIKMIDLAVKYLFGENPPTGLKMTDVGLYSMSPYTHGLFIAGMFHEILRDYRATIIDAPSGLGGTAYHLAKLFRRVDCVEVNPTHMRIMRENGRLVLDRRYQSRIRLQVGNYLDYLFGIPLTPLLAADSIGLVAPLAVHLDLPWGGVAYKKEEKIELYLSDASGKMVSQQKIIEQLLRAESGADVVIAKVPRNIIEYGDLVTRRINLTADGIAIRYSLLVCVNKNSKWAAEYNSRVARLSDSYRLPFVDVHKIRGK